MNTLQSNDSNESLTTLIEPTAAQNPQSAQNAVEYFKPSEERQPLDSQTEALTLNLLLENGSITKEQRDWGRVVVVDDFQMAPLINAGAWIACTLLDPMEYQSTVGSIVAILPTDAESETVIDQHIVGRLEAITNRYAYLTFDNPDFPSRRISRKQIAQLFKAIWLVRSPLL